MCLVFSLTTISTSVVDSNRLHDSRSAVKTKLLLLKTLLLATLTILYACQQTVPPGASPTVSTTPSELAGSHWQLVNIQSMDDSLYTPKSKQNYTLKFEAQGKVLVQSDCNRGFGTWTSAQPGQLLFGPVALTKMACPADSLDDRFNLNLSYVRSYVMQQGNLYLATMADGAILKFERVSQQTQE